MQEPERPYDSRQRNEAERPFGNCLTAKLLAGVASGAEEVDGVDDVNVDWQTKSFGADGRTRVSAMKTLNTA